MIDSVGFDDDNTSDSAPNTQGLLSRLGLYSFIYSYESDTPRVFVSDKPFSYSDLVYVTLIEEGIVDSRNGQQIDPVDARQIADYVTDPKSFRSVIRNALSTKRILGDIDELVDAMDDTERFYNDTHCAPGACPTTS